jgi:hypothetical protein
LAIVVDKKWVKNNQTIQKMKRVFLICFYFLLFVLITNTTYAQDLIVLKTGDEISSKVLEVTSDVVKYKKWTNQEGPTYSSAKAEIFMIKYANGTKDVFNNLTVTGSNTSSPSNSGNKFIGTWYHKRYDGNNNKTTMTISKPGDDFLVVYSKLSRGGGYDSFYNTDGSFKEMGRLEGNSIVINSFIKLSLMDDKTILMNSEEFRKSNSADQSGNNSITKSSFTGYYNTRCPDGEYKYVNGIYYKSNLAEIKSAIFDVNGAILNTSASDIRFKGTQRKDQFLTVEMAVEGFKIQDLKSNYDLSCQIIYNGKEYDRKENMDWLVGSPLTVKLAYNTPSLTPGAFNSHTFYVSFLIKDKYSSAVVQGFYIYTIEP